VSKRHTILIEKDFILNEQTKIYKGIYCVLFDFVQLDSTAFVFLSASEILLGN
jgi:hypothetical protein